MFININCLHAVGLSHNLQCGWQYGNPISFHEILIAVAILVPELFLAVLDEKKTFPLPQSVSRVGRIKPQNHHPSSSSSPSSSSCSPSPSSVATGAAALSTWMSHQTGTNNNNNNKNPENEVTYVCMCFSVVAVIGAWLAVFPSSQAEAKRCQNLKICSGAGPILIWDPVGRFYCTVYGLSTFPGGVSVRRQNVENGKFCL